ncbi:peptidase inhibitor family I36 protein [Streptomyces sp. SGAir0957]
MKSAKKAMVGAGLAMAASALIATATTPASAAASASNLKMCLNTYLGGACDYEYLAFSNLTWGSDGNFQDGISSISNYSGKTWCLYTDNNYGGIEGVFQNNYTWNTLSYPYNDSISSGRPC